ncbi:ABC transporter ATP-binding protein [Methylophaga sp.]|uniref:ABC transporter ATP-binding protein n=1 Tax=Methylophaga sp. TaxID=2024840 RepID=UPI003A8F5FC2
MKAQQSKTNQKSKVAFQDIWKTWQVLPHTKKGRAVVVFLMIIFGTTLEMLSIGLVLPFLAALTGDAGGYQLELINKLKHTFIFINDSSLLISLLFILLGGFVIKNTFLTILSWIQSKFIFDTQSDLATELLESYLAQPYTFHLQKNTAELINNLQVELNLFIVYMLSPSLLLLAEFLVVGGLVSLLFVFEPIGTLLVASFFLVFGFLFQLLTKNRVGRWGKKRQYEESLRMKHAKQALSAVKEIKLYRKEDFFISRYAVHTKNSLTMNQRSSFIHSLTRLWLEIIALSGIVLLYLIMMFQGKENEAILPTVGLFAAVAFRLLPSLNRIMGALNQLRFGATVVDLIYHEFSKFRSNENQLFNKKISEKWRFSEQVELKNIYFTYPNNTKHSLSNINVSIRRGQMVGFIGESGSGKSTLINLFLGLLQADSGKLSVDGVDINLTLEQWQKNIGYVPQNIYLTDDKLKNNIAFGVKESEIDSKALTRAIQSAQLDKLVRELPDGLDTIVGEHGDRLSGGQRQRIGIARALYNDPDILVFDEATSALDYETEKDVIEAINVLHRNKTIVVIAHRESAVEKCDVIYRLASGHIIEIDKKLN